VAGQSSTAGQGRGLTLVWLPEASHERFKQLDYIARDNPLAAADQDDEIERQVDTLQTHPKLGRPGRVKGTRELVIGRTPFIVAYRLKGQRIEVMRFLRGSQHWPEVF
jgi:toxin ParE1/3/4